MEIKGFKAFLPGLKTLEGNPKLEVGNKYHVDGPVIFNRNGFHFCKRLEDTLHFFSGYKSDIDICEVIGSGDIHQTWSDYYGYYDLYAASDLEIVRKLSRLEILKMYKEIAQNYSDIRILRFLRYYPNLTQEELEYMGVKDKTYTFYY